MKHFNEDFYNEDYFKPKSESNKSSFTMPYIWEIEQKEAFVMADRLISLFQPKSVYDIGCGKGFLLKAFKNRGIKKIAGIDISHWVIENSDPDVKQNLVAGDIRDGIPGDKNEYDIVVSFSTLEHIEEEYINDVLWNMKNISKNWVYISIPVNLIDDNKEYEGDFSHVTMKTPAWWISHAYESGLNFDPRLSNMTSSDPMYNMNFVFCKHALERWIYEEAKK